MLDYAIMAQAAEPSEIICAQKRDDAEMHWVSSQLADCFRKLFGEELWLKYYKLFPLVGSFLYLFATNVQGAQTMGEEYVCLLQVDGKNRIPSLPKRMLFAVLEALMSSKLVSVPTKFIPNILKSVDIESLHNALFFAVDKRYYRISKRFSRIQLLGIRPQLDMMPTIFYKALGFLTLVQYVTIFASNVLNRLNAAHTNDADSGLLLFHQLGVKICKICSSNGRSVCLPCGHLFCASCFAFCREDDDSLIKCPYCRNKFPTNRAIFPLNL